MQDWRDHLTTLDLLECIECPVQIKHSGLEWTLLIQKLTYFFQKSAQEPSLFIDA